MHRADSGAIVYVPVKGLGEIRAGMDLARPIVSALRRQDWPLADDDVLVVTQKIVSKAAGRIFSLRDVHPSPRARALALVCDKDARLVEMVLRESVALVRVAPQTLIVRHRLGFVMANAGIDQSNLPGGGDGDVLLLPENPDAEAAALRAAIAEACGARIGVVISDSFGRPWREGVVNIAIGAAGVPSLIDRRGARDRHGRALRVTQIAWADAVAAAAGLMMGEADEGIPAICVRGLRWTAPERPASKLVRPLSQDLFS